MLPRRLDAWASPSSGSERFREDLEIRDLSPNGPCPVDGVRWMQQEIHIFMDALESRGQCAIAAVEACLLQQGMGGNEVELPSSEPVAHLLCLLCKPFLGEIGLMFCDSVSLRSHI